MVGHHSQLVSLRGHASECTVGAHGYPVDLAIWNYQPEGHPGRIPADVHHVAVVVGDVCDVAVPRVSEVVQVVSRRQALGIQMLAAGVKEVQLLVDGGGQLVHVLGVEERLVLPDESDSDVSKVSHVELPVGTHSQGRGGIQLGILGIAIISGEAIAVGVVFTVAAAGGTGDQGDLTACGDLPDAVDLFLIRLGDVQDSVVRDS